MSAAPSSALEKMQRRALPRHAVRVTLDVVVLRSGVPEHLPGRCTDLSENGVGAIIAGNLAPDQQVALELRLPNLGVPVRARARVCYQEQLRCGLQFAALPIDQREMIRYWLQRSAASGIRASQERESPKTEAVTAAAVKERHDRRIRLRLPLRRLYPLAALLGILALVGWWQWQRSWNELDAHASFAGAGSPIRVPAEIMEQRIVYKARPVYPEEARLGGKQGMVILDAVIGADGTVRRVRAVSGPELLAQAAADAVRSWRFEPYQAGGKPAEVETSIAVDFRLN